MADPSAVKFLEDVYDRVDRQVRAIIEPFAPSGIAEVDDIEIVIGDGVAVITTGVATAIRIDFPARITGAFVQEFDGTTGSIVLGIAIADPGPSPTFTSIVASAPPTITSGRYVADETLSGWTTLIERGQVLRFSVTSCSLIKRILVTLRIRRLEP